MFQIKIHISKSIRIQGLQDKVKIFLEKETQSSIMNSKFGII